MINKRSPVGILIFLILFLVIFDIYYQLLDSEGSIFKSDWFRHRIFLIAATSLIVILYFIIRKITESKNEQELISKMLIEKQEENWRKISAELHDSLGQNLLILNNRILQFQKSKFDKESFKRWLDEISLLSQESLEEVRRISGDLYPNQLEKLGLTSSIESTLKKVSLASGIKINIRTENIDSILTKENEINLFRIIQEAFNNIVKHSKAAEAGLEIYCNEKFITVRIQDNGVGFNPRESHTGFGIQNIHERSRLLRASLNIVSGRNKGAVIILNIPVKSKHLNGNEIYG
jgi:signal transduction histidine kinase